MNKISGKVVVKESGVGIPDLLVVIYDVDPKTKPEEWSAGTTFASSSRTSAIVFEQGFPGDRLGSVLTDQNGAFELSYEDEEFQVRNPEEKRPDLFLLVLAPEEVGQDLNSRILFTSTGIRHNAGRNEQILIRLTSEQLETTDIPLPTIPDEEVEESKSIVRRFTDAEVRREDISDGLRDVAKKRVTHTRTVIDSFGKTFKPALRRALSGLPEKLVEPERFVAPGESVLQKSNGTIKRGIKNIVNNPKNRAPVISFVTLTDAQKDELTKHIDEQGNVPAEEFEKILNDGKSNNKTATFFVREDPLVQFCRDATRDERDCAELLFDTEDERNGDGSAGTTPTQPPEETNRTGEGVILATEEGIERYIARLMDTMTSPEEEVVTGLTPRADQAIVQQNIEQLSLQRSPADLPAFYDFHHLQIAFEHVWQEAIDEDILNLSEDIYQQIVELGGDPERDLDGTGGGGRDPIRALLNEGKLVLKAHGAESPPGGNARTPAEFMGQSSRRDRYAGRCVTVTDDRTGTSYQVNCLSNLLAELLKRLQEEYPFTIFAANRKERSVNFGILVTYRQKWEPLNYQAGELVKTITLAPKEIRKFSMKKTINRKRSEKEVEKNLRSRREEVSQTTRAEQEIIRKAEAKTNFTLTTEGTYDIGVSEGTATSSFSRDASKTSSDVKKSFHEAVFKAAQEYKQERTTEVLTEESEMIEVTESGEIMNPNDEIAVTFLFYELQRRYRVTETIHQLRPVILVAQEVPEPDEIDEDWLVTYDWILRRVILDDSFLPALDYLSQNVVGDEFALNELRRNVEDQRKIVNQLRQELTIARERSAVQRALLEQSIFRTANVVAEHRTREEVDDDFSITGFTSDIVSTLGGVGSALVGGISDFVFGDGGSGAGQSRYDALKEVAEQAANEARDLLFRLEREVTALNAITETYTKTLSVHLNRRTQIARLRVHIKQNILYYMQAIWLHEPPDQRFFRLHNVQVPTLKVRFRPNKVDLNTPDEGLLASAAYKRLNTDRTPPKPAKAYRFEANWEIAAELQFAPLVKVADLDNPLGFKGNYMLFQLNESNALTDFMMEPYIDHAFNTLVDPDDLGNWTLEEFTQYVCCLKENLSEAEFEALREQLKNQYARLLAAPRRSGQVITTPIDSLFIEALPARHSLIEEFKARHRAIDVKMVQAQVRKEELENIRRAARLLEGEREDPDIEAKYVFEGDGTATVVPPGTSGGGSGSGN